eukprot:349677-Chlamydomonas_euryale.AAC.7
MPLSLCDEPENTVVWAARRYEALTVAICVCAATTSVARAGSPHRATRSVAQPRLGDADAHSRRRRPPSPGAPVAPSLKKSLRDVG